ncbi:MAG: alkaline phosphatase family protein [Bacteroidia bacterium]
MRKALLFVVTVSVAAVSLAQSGKKNKTVPEPVPDKPALAVGIVVDQMRYDYVYRYWDKLGNDGFKRLLSQGTNCTNTNYNYMPTYTGPGHASIFTGTTPSVHGIIANNWYEREEAKVVYCAQDAKVQGVGSSDEEGQRSPVRMNTTTVGDQLKLATNAKSKVIGIALKDRGAILPAGHTANAAYWFDGKTGNWITSTYYMKSLPDYVNAYNSKKVPMQLLNQDWTTLLPIDQYTESLPDNNPYEGLFKGELQPTFPHKLASLHPNNGGAGMIRTTPFGNTLTREFAQAVIIGENLGKGSSTDFLSVSFSSPDYIGHMYGPQSIEVEDCYLRLDQEIAAFLKFLDNWCGKNNVLLFLTADHGAVENPQFLNDISIPSGFFNEQAASDSLKKAFKRQFGDTLIQAWENDQIFLNRKTIAAKGLNKTEIERFAATYLMQFKGVSFCMTGTDIGIYQYNTTPHRQIQNGFNVRRSGDVCVVLQPGWISDWGRKTGTTHGAPWSYDTHVPLYWWGWKINTGKTDASVQITDIAPSLCSMLNIQFPSGCTGTPIQGLLK